MPTRSKARSNTAIIWERPEAARRSAPEPLSREAIVGAGLAIADREGLMAVSLRNVGAALNAGAMRFYTHLSTKEELLELMVDAVYAQMAPPSQSEWREALRSIADGIRQAVRKHPWFVELLGGRPHQGPHALAHRERSLSAMAATGLSIDAALQAVRTVNAYVIGALLSEAGERQAELETGMTKREWQDASWPYLQRMLATGRFPCLARVVKEARHPSPDAAFDAGLECLLDGVAAQRARGVTRD